MWKGGRREGNRGTWEKGGGEDVKGRGTGGRGIYEEVDGVKSGGYNRNRVVKRE